jgi:hypothetical protein
MPRVGGFASVATAGKSELEKTNDWLEAIYNLVSNGIQGVKNVQPPLARGNP